MASSSSAAWMKDIQDRMKKASSEVNTALQPRVVMAKRSIEEGMQSMGLRHGKEIYDHDAGLLDAITSLEEVRALLRALSSTVDAHRKNLLATAASERALGELIAAPAPPGSTVLQDHVPPARVEAQVALGSAQQAASNAVSRFALDMATPMVDLSRTFEEAFAAKIAPLKKLYASQKAEYARYARQAAACDDPVRRANLDSIAQSARPVWERTSETLRAEVQALVSHVMANLSEWTLNVAQAEAEMFARASAVLDAPARLAEASQQE